MSFYDGPIDPPEHKFGTCLFCKCSEEDHVIVDIDEGSRFPTTYTVCPAVVDVAEAIEADYPSEVVSPDYMDEDFEDNESINSLVNAYEDAMADIIDNTYDEE